MEATEATTLKPKDSDSAAPLATITYNSGRVAVRVTNEDAFFDYVLANHPSEIMVREEVAPAFRDKLLDAAKASGETPPWATVITGSPFLSVKVSERGTALADLLISALLGSPAVLPDTPVVRAIDQFIADLSIGTRRSRPVYNDGGIRSDQEVGE